MRIRIVAAGLMACALMALQSEAAQTQREAHITQTPPTQQQMGRLDIELKTILGYGLSGRVRLRTQDQPPVVLEVPDGRVSATCPPGSYKAYVHVYDDGVPVMIAVRDVEVIAGRTQPLNVELLLGGLSQRPLLDFDNDGDLVLDGVELDAGTDPYDASSIPGRKAVIGNPKVIDKKAAWYRGDLHVHSSYGNGKETVAQLVSRAEKLGLDFLAIADPNTMAAAFDVGHVSDKVVLIPAMQWGSKERGWALIYGPRTVPVQTDNIMEAQGVCNVTQQQGGVFAIAKPCFPDAPWQWGLGYAYAVEVWCRDWRGVPPMSFDRLDEDLQFRVLDQDKFKLVYPMAIAASRPGCSANGQAATFWDESLNRGLMACAIGGSHSASPKVPMAQPVTYVYAEEKSLPGILDGIRRGRTFVSCDLKGPRIIMSADVLKDGTIDIKFPGGIVPVGVETRFEIQVWNAKGKRLEILHNGLQYAIRKISSNKELHSFSDTPQNNTVYRAQIIETPKKKGFGLRRVLALTSPVYARQFIVVNPNEDPEDNFIRIEGPRKDSRFQPAERPDFERALERQIDLNK